MIENNDTRVVLSVRVRQETKIKLDNLKKQNPDISWDLILEPILNPFKYQKPQTHSLPQVLKIPVSVKYPTDVSSA